MKMLFTFVQNFSEDKCLCFSQNACISKFHYPGEGYFLGRGHGPLLRLPHNFSKVIYICKKSK